MMDEIAKLIGYAVMLACGVAFSAGAMILAVVISNRTSRLLKMDGHEHDSASDV